MKFLEEVEQEMNWISNIYKIRLILCIEFFIQINTIIFAIKIILYNRQMYNSQFRYLKCFYLICLKLQQFTITSTTTHLYNWFFFYFYYGIRLNF